MNSQRKQVVLLGAGFTTRNMGVWALASGAVASILHAYPNARISFLDYDTAPGEYDIRVPGGSKVVQSVNLRFSKKVWQQNHIVQLLVKALAIRAIPFRSLRNWLVSRNFWLRHIASADLIGSIAGGDSFSDIYGLEQLLYVTLPQVLILLLGKPLVFLPQTLGPFTGRPAKIIARFILKRAHLIYSRDGKCSAALYDLLDGDRNRVRFSYDMGFVLEPYIRRERVPSWLDEHTRGHLVVGLNVSGLLYMGGYTKNNMFRLKVDYPQLMLDLIEFFVEKHNCRILLVPHVFGDEEGGESDVSACRELLHRIEPDVRKCVHLLDEKYDHHELKALIGRCDFFLGSRMHACIAALSQCVPAIGLAYSEKFHGVFTPIGMDQMVIDLRHTDEKSVVSLVRRQFRQCSHYHAQLESQIPSVKASVLNLFSEISQAGCHTPSMSPTGNLRILHNESAPSGH